ncbi:MAG: Ig-like domain-containing protein, partial [Lachnospiraceae bacterium]|nr:Ig-like domain-containing protein [Lachnospiraceae bacterium]
NGTHKGPVREVVKMDLPRIVDIGCCGCHSAAVDEDGNLWMWGCNSYGQLGDGTKTDRHVPVQISLGDGGNNAGALTSDTEDAASGEDGQTAEYAAADNVVEFPAAGAYSINGNEIDFTGLDADSLYNVYSMKNKSAADPLAASNLLYIAQAATDGTGALSVNCVPKASVAAPDIFAVKYRAPVRTVSVSNIVLSRAQLQMKKGETAVLSAEVLPKDANDRAVIWDSTDAGVATVDQNGKVTAVNDGMTFVSATSHDGGYPVFCKVCVSEPSPEPGGPDDPDPIDPDDDIEEGDLPDGRSAPEGIWVGGLKKSYPYTGNAIKPVFRVYKEKNRLNEKTDYTLNYANNKKPGTATVTIKMKGSYSGSKDVTFEISTASLETQVSADTVLKAYKKNSTQKPKPVLYVNGVKLKYGKNDLTFTYPSTASENGTPYRDTGTWKIHIEAKNTKLFTGEKDVDLVIVDKPLMSSVTVTADKNRIPYDNGKPVSPVFTLKYRGQPLVAGSDYTVIYEDDHSSIGKHRVTFAGNNKDFFGTKTYTINITGKYDLTSDLANVSLNSADLNTDGSAPFTYGGAKPEAVVKYNGKKLTPGKDYTVTYTGHKSLGEATATIKGKESFKGSVPVTFSVVKRDINTISPNIADVVYSAKKDAYKKTSIMFVDSCFKDQKLKKDSDYTLTFTGDHGDAPAAGTQIKVVIEGKGNYTGKIDASYRIIDKDHDLTKAKVTVNGGKAYDYTGNEIRPALSDIKVTLNGAALKDDCYEILGYYNNVKKGNSAYIRLRGKGEYAGVKMVKFKIGAAFLEKMWDGIIQRILTPEEKTDNCTCSAAAKIIE